MKKEDFGCSAKVEIRNGNTGLRRWDHELIYRLIRDGSSVLDLGCGDGSLLSKLITDKCCFGLGVEIKIDRILKAVENGVPVIQTDIDKGLDGFADKSFDYVVLEKTLQAVNNPIFVLDEMLRVGRAGIISFPNFGYKEVVRTFTETGKMPVTPTLPYHWYDTPNIHLFTVKDFLELAETKNVKIVCGFSYKGGEPSIFEEEDSTEAEEVLFVIEKG